MIHFNALILSISIFSIIPINVYSQTIKLETENTSSFDKPDFSIAIDNIALITSHKRKNLYHFASKMYYWGLDDKNASRELIRKEMLMIQPIMNKIVFNTWEAVFDNNPTDVLRLIQEFWLNTDPTPHTFYNERLIEHWERIAYARKHFTRQNTSIYNTDDRGIAWVKFGKPDTIHFGELTISNTKVFNLVNRRLSLHKNNKLEGIEQQETRLADQNSICFKKVISYDKKNDSNTIKSYSKKIAHAVFTNSKRRAYEIWIYTDHIRNKENNHILIYGETALKGYAKAKTINDFISPSSFSSSNRYTFQNFRYRNLNIDYEITIGVILQYEYLRQLMTIDPQFEKAFINLKNDFFNIKTIPKKDQALIYRRRHELKAKQIEIMAPQQVFNYEIQK